jgi:hypothetical protein
VSTREPVPITQYQTTHDLTPSSSAASILFGVLAAASCRSSQWIAPFIEIDDALDVRPPTVLHTTKIDLCHTTDLCTSRHRRDRGQLTHRHLCSKERSPRRRVHAHPRRMARPSLHSDRPPDHRWRSCSRLCFCRHSEPTPLSSFKFHSH